MRLNIFGKFIHEHVVIAINNVFFDIGLYYSRKSTRKKYDEEPEQADKKLADPSSDCLSFAEIPSFRENKLSIYVHPVIIHSIA